jgi:colanic acid/amylovoran biosynthesis glycosyltransferase
MVRSEAMQAASDAFPPAAAPGAAAGLRIAYVIPAYPPAPSQPFVVNEMVAVQEAGHAIVIVPLYAGSSSPVRHGTFERLAPAGVLPAALVDLRILGAALLALLTRPLRAIGVLLSIHRAAGRNPFAHARLLAVTPKALAAAWWLRRLGIDRIHAHFATQTADCAAIAGCVSGIPFSFTAHAYDIYSTALRVRNDTLGWKLRRARQVFTVNQFAADLLRRDLPAEARGRVQTVYVGIPMHLFRAAPPPDGDVLRLLCVARFCEKKGLDTLIDACALLRDQRLPFELRLYGDGPLRGALATQIARLRLERQVLLGDGIAQEEVAREMQACHLFVMPCRRDRRDAPWSAARCPASPSSSVTARRGSWCRPTTRRLWRRR